MLLTQKAQNLWNNNCRFQQKEKIYARGRTVLKYVCKWLLLSLPTNYRNGNAERERNKYEFKRVTHIHLFVCIQLSSFVHVCVFKFPVAIFSLSSSSLPSVYLMNTLNNIFSFHFTIHNIQFIFLYTSNFIFFSSLLAYRHLYIFFMGYYLLEVTRSKNFT